MSLTTTVGNVLANDVGAEVTADDSTDVNGNTRITIASLAGCGTLGVFLKVSGSLQGTKFAKVRTTDHDADGRITSADLGFGVQCDLNFDGVVNPTDLSFVSAHRDHWHRNALHGKPIRRTDFTYTAGASKTYWSPNGRWLSTTAFDLLTESVVCRVFLLPSDPKDGNKALRFTFSDSADYDAAWSPLGHEVTFGRKDLIIYRKGILGLAADTSTRRVTSHNNGSVTNPRGDIMGAISPDGQWVVFSRRTTDPGPFELFKIPINGDSSQTLQLTSHAAAGPADHYPQWSPDGDWIIFQRQLSSGSSFDIYKIRADGTDNFNATLVYDPPPSGGVEQTAANPAYSPDGKVVILAKGPQPSSLERFTHTIDPALSSPKSIPNYPEWRDSYGLSDPFLMPMFSPDGTRMCMRAKDDQIWVTRRNMSLPPRITQVGTQTLPDSAATVIVPASAGIYSSADVYATDEESDPITCGIYLKQWWMAFNPANCRLTLRPPQSAVGKTFYAVLWVTTPSGGTDKVIAVIPVSSGSAPGSAGSAVADDSPATRPEGFVFPAIGQLGSTIRAEVFDLIGRRIASMRGPAGSPLSWDGRDAHGARATPGVYLYRVSCGVQQRTGKIVVVR